MLGSQIGIQVGGTTIATRTLTIRVPKISATADFLEPATPGGSSVTIPKISATADFLEPNIILVINVPVISATADFLEPQTPGGSSVTFPVINATADFKEPNLVFIVPGIPSFVASRSGTTVDLTFSDRDGKKIGVWRADEFNLNFEEIATVDADTYEDSGLTATLNYKYQIQFVSTVSGVVSARGRKTGSKYTKA